MRLVGYALAALSALGSSSARASEMPLVNLSPPPPSFFSRHDVSIWHPAFFGVRAPYGPGRDGLADLSPPPETIFETIERFWRHPYDDRAPMTRRSDGMIDLSPPPRKFYEAMFDNWPSGWFLPRRAIVSRADGMADISPPPPTYMYAGGIEGWHSGAFVYGALVWSPHGLYDAGFTAKLLSGGGAYRYNSGALKGAEITGVQRSTSVMAGWRFKQDKFEATIYGGFDMQEHSLSRYDPGNRMTGVLYGVRVGADLWHEPRPGAMVAANLSVSSIGPSYSARIATGWWIADAVWLGPELQNIGNPAYGDPSYMQWRIGAHATSFSFMGFEWSLAAGYVGASDGRQGAYGRFSMLGRY